MKYCQMLKPIVIAKAWLNVLKGITTDEHKKRASICKECKHSKHSKYLDFINDELVDVKGLICNDCNCPISAKIRSIEKCRYWK